ncbi:serine/threonine-protein kinase [Streptomyces griseus]|uniref:hypothetical protein n=1 Tax=Streptomyces griseus TaxID=1911 RepID=UPI00256FD058|nr:hypothetical protein [Streptomyces fimicarius]
MTYAPGITTPFAPGQRRCPQEARRAAKEMCGGPVLTQQVSDRRGSAVWIAIGPDRTAAVKVGYDSGTAVTAREAQVLERMPLYQVIHGTTPGGYWFTTPWHPGPSTWDAFGEVRQSSANWSGAHRAAVDLCRAVADLHASGWVHGDLQAEHAIHTPAGVRLIDLSWASGPGFLPPDQFSGGVPHLLAPELAASISEGVRPVAPTREAEVYTLAGCLWASATGRWPLDYAWAGIDPKTIGADELRRKIAHERLPLDQHRPWPELQHILEEVLLAPADDRATAAELADLILYKVSP